MKGFWILILAGLIVPVIACKRNQQSPADRMVTNRQATVDVMFTYKAEGESVPEHERRTGIVVSTHYVLTQVPNRKGFDKVGLGIAIRQNGESTLVMTTDELVDRPVGGQGHHLGLIKSSRKLTSQVGFSTALTKPGDPHYSIEMMFGSYPSVHRGTVNYVHGNGKIDSGYKNILVIDALLTNTPNSGSETIGGAGIFNKDGALIGIVSHQAFDGGFIWVVTPSIEIRSFLDRKGIKYRKIE